MNGRPNRCHTRQGEQVTVDGCVCHRPGRLRAPAGPSFQDLCFVRQLLLYTRYAVERVCACETSGLYLELVCGVKGEEPLKN